MCTNVLLNVKLPKFPDTRLPGIVTLRRGFEEEQLRIIQFNPDKVRDVIAVAILLKGNFSRRLNKELNFQMIFT